MEDITQEAILDMVVDLSRRRALESRQSLVRLVEQELGAARGSLRPQTRFICTVADGCKLSRVVLEAGSDDHGTMVDAPRPASPVSGYESDDPAMSDDEGSVVVSVYQDSDSETESTDRYPAGPGDAKSTHPDRARPCEADVADTVCLACRDGAYSETNHILLCDGCFENGEPCPSAFHQACVFPFQPVPLGNWLCPDCVSDVAAGLWRGGDNTGARRESRTGPCFQATLPELCRAPAARSPSPTKCTTHNNGRLRASRRSFGAGKRLKLDLRKPIYVEVDSSAQEEEED